MLHLNTEKGVIFKGKLHSREVRSAIRSKAARLFHPLKHETNLNKIEKFGSYRSEDTSRRVVSSGM
jgi:hypothetical protein